MRGLVVYVIAKEFLDLTPDLARVANGVEIGESVIALADEEKSGGPKGRNREQEEYEQRLALELAEALPSARNFH